jgi:Holliday junction resolvasome RuvABC endonuclease subunit
MAVVLGIRCTHADMSFAVLAGSQAAPKVLAVGEVAYPKGYQRPQRLQWIVQEADGLIKTHGVDLVVIKQFEGMTKGNRYEERVEAEGAIAVAAGQNGIKQVYKKRKNTLAKDLGLKGRARYLATSLNTAAIPSYSDLPEKRQEAVLCAWSAL